MSMLTRRDRYVYVYFSVDGSPIYVGKGCGNRWKRHLHFRNLPVVIIRDGMSNCEACEMEQAFIRAIGRFDIGTGPLLNKTDGGVGTFGRKHTPEAIEKMRRAATGERSAEFRHRCSVRMRGFRHSAETKAKMSAAHYGRKLSSEHRTKMSAGGKGKVLSVEHRAKLAEILRRPKSEAHKAKLSALCTERNKRAA